MTKMTNDYQRLKLSREELLVTAGYNKRNAVYQFRDDQGAENPAPENAQGPVDQ